MHATRATRQRKRPLTGAALIAALALGACSSAKHVAVPTIPNPPKSKSASGATPSFPDTGINATTLTVTGVEPGSGPFAGGNQVLVRGSGFTADAIVFFADHMVQPADTLLQDRNTLSVIVPAGEPGSADVKVMLASGDEATKSDAYTYNPLLIEPTSGSVAGNTSVLITASGSNFDETVEVTIGGQACSNLQVVTPSELRCRTPPGNPGFADVEVDWPASATTPEPPLIATQAFEYKDLTDTDYGGLDGGPIEGTINITVVDSIAGNLIPNAFVLIGDDPKGPYQGQTDAQGHITFTGDDLHGPVTVHVSAKCMERTSIVAFDAQNVTVHVTPLLDPSCGMPGNISGGGRGTSGSIISGELIFPGANEFTVNNWDVLPQPRANEVRVTYVYTTRAAYNVLNPSPAVNGSMARILETSTPGMRGYPYRIFARPAGLAVYAISGLERTDTGEFTPYVMGVARNVLTSPGQETSGTDIQMDLNLSYQESVTLSSLPSAGKHSPDTFRVEADIDLGGQGVIVREVNGRPLDLISSVTSGSLFRFFAQPPFQAELADARYFVVAGWYTGNDNVTPPYTEVRRSGVTQSPAGLTIDDFLSLPQPTAPLDGGRLPDDRVLRWQAVAPQPDLYLIDVTDGNGIPAWTQFVPGALTQSTLPDFSTIDGMSDIAPGLLSWSIRALQIDGFVFDELKYNELSSRFWTHTSVDTFTMQR